ncbi:MAG: FkbM family methyltransferase [Bacteriovorax sp.]|jgi:FkbM family methyltransferase
MQIEKFESLTQKVQYSKLYRLPMWLIRKIKHHKVDATNEHTVDMRMGHKICLYPTQRYLKNTLVSSQYHDENIFLAKQFLKPNPVIIDIGANIGLYTCAYAQHFKDLNPVIFAFEAVDTNYNLLMKNIGINHFKNIHAFHVALGEAPGFLEFSLPSADFVGNATGNNVAETAESTSGMVVKKVKLDTLDNLASQNSITRCDFIKVDIEGAELFLFKGAKSFINKTRPVIQFEYNKYWLERNSICLKDFAEIFLPLNYSFYIEEKDHFLKIEDVNNYTVTHGLVDFLIVPNEKSVVI